MRADSLDDMDVPPEKDRYFRAKAALSMFARGTRTMARVFKLYDLPLSEYDWFCENYPQEKVLQEIADGSTN